MTPKQTIIYPKAHIHSLKRLFKMGIGIILLITAFHYAMAANHWRSLAPGIDYQDIATNHLTPWSHIHTFRIQLNNTQFSLITAKDLKREFASVDDYARASHAQIAINGGFFDRLYHPLGLRIRNHHSLSPLKPISWWGVFAIQGNHASITSSRQFNPSSSIDFAIQSGPRLLINGKIPHLKPGRDERSALGITRDGHVIILVTEHAALTTAELAKRLKAPPLNCTNALNLDGGSSSQLYAAIRSFHLNVHGFSNVSDAIIVTSQ